MQISEWVSGRVDLCVDGLARRRTDGRGWVGMCADVLHADGRGMERVGVRADGWVCMRMSGCACGWVGCVWISEWVSMRVDLQADGLIQRERLRVDTDGLARRWRGRWVCVRVDERG